MNNTAYLIMQYLLDQKTEFKSEFDAFEPCQIIQWQKSGSYVKNILTIREDSIYLQQSDGGFSLGEQIKSFSDFWRLV